MSALRLLLPLAAVMVALAASAQTLPGADAVPEEAGEAEQAPVALEAAPDERIAARLQSVFDRVEAFASIHVEVQDGVVYLDGTVQRAEARERAERFALRLEGVVFVVNEVEVQRDVEARVTPAVDRLQSFINATIAYLPVLVLSVGIILAAWGIGYLLTRSDRPFQLLRINPLMTSLLRRLILVVIVLAGIFIAIDILDITALAGAAIGAAGIVGLALGFAFRDIAENYLAGILMSVRRPFGVGDLVRIDTHEGHIIRLTARELVLLTLDGNHIRLPNATVFKSVIYNYSTNPQRQFRIDVGVAPDTDLARAQEVGLQTLRETDGVLDDPEPFSRVMELAESTVLLSFFAWVDQREHGFVLTRSEAVRRVKEGFDAAGIAMPVPSYSVAVHRPRRDGERHPPPARGSRSTHRSHAEEAVADDQIRQDLAASRERNLLDEAR